MPEWTYSREAQRYRNTATGRFVSMQTVRERGLEPVMRASESRMAELTQQRIDGLISTNAWRSGMALEIKIIHIEAAMAANGGRAQMSQADWGRVGARIKSQYRFLDNYAGQVAAGAQPLDGRMLSRSRMYADAARATFEETRRGARMETGWQEERRILGPAEHCQPSDKAPGCIQLAAKGWRRIGTLPAIGQTTCRTRCRCHFVYRKRDRRGRWSYSRE